MQTGTPKMDVDDFEDLPIQYGQVFNARKFNRW